MASRRASRRGVIETLLLPVASAVVISSAAVHAMAHRRCGEGEAPEGAVPPEFETPVDYHRRAAPAGGLGGPLGWLARHVSWLRPAIAIHQRYGEIGGNHLAAAFTFRAFLSLFPSSSSASPSSGSSPPVPTPT